MLTLDELKKLKTLYQYRYLGYSYYKDEQKIDNRSYEFMPGSIDELHHTISNCQLCSLSNHRKSAIIGSGNTNSSLMFIGEAPNVSEDIQGEVFAGKSGEMLINIIENVLELKKDDVYVANIVKCKPPQSRVPTSDEVNLCKPYLLKQINIVNPSIIVTLGETSYRYLTGELEASLSKIRGELLTFGNSKLIATYHPSYLLRTPSAKKDVYYDMLKVKGLL